MEKEAGQVPQFADQPVFAVDFDGDDLHADHVSVSVDFYWFVNDTFSDRPPTCREIYQRCRVRECGTRRPD